MLSVVGTSSSRNVIPMYLFRLRSIIVAQPTAAYLCRHCLSKHGCRRQSYVFLQRHNKNYEYDRYWRADKEDKTLYFLLDYAFTLSIAGAVYGVIAAEQSGNSCLNAVGFTFPLRL